MRRLPRLYIALLRYRVAAMVGMFTLLGAAREGRLDLNGRFAFAVAALASSYVAATSLNDLADEDIDRVNHPRDAGRPLVEGTGTRRDLKTLHALAAVLALAAAMPLGLSGVALVAASLAVSWAYSAPPLRISYRIAGAPLLLGFAYVVIPVGLGLVAARSPVGHAFSLFTAALFLLFAARILLKDFRDREGDARFGKPTLLLRYGKSITCGASAVALVAADAVLAATLPLALALLIQPFVVAIGWMLRRLRDADTPHLEQIAIGIGARAGNGLLLTVLGWFAVAHQGASTLEATTFGAALAALILATVAGLAANPDQAVLGYKG